MNTIKATDTPAIIAGKYLAGQLATTPITEIMRAIRKRSAAMENRLDAENEAQVRPELRVVG